MRLRPILAVALLLGSLACPGPAAAWGAKAHRVVARLAQDQLRPQAAAAVAQLLAGEPDPTLAGVAYWADEQRELDTDLGRRTVKWHYLNFPRGSCEYVPARDCPDGNCVVGAINRQFLVLGDAARPAPERAQALKFLVHLVADAHQPLHAGAGDDAGGNRYPLQYRDEGTNLHAAWDRLVPARRDLDPAAYARFLGTLPPLPADPTRQSDRPAADWAVESCRLVQAPGFYPAGHVLADAYLDAQLPVAERRLREAGRRLADLLNHALAGPLTAEASR
jgi:hypothetical protein